MTTRSERRGGWETAALRAMEWIAYPAMAGAAFCILCVGVVTWLPALAAVAHALHRWRSDGDSRCFTGVVAAFPGYWRALWRHAVISTAGLVALVATAAFLAGRPEAVAIPLFGLQVGALAAALPYHLALAVVAGSDGLGHRRPDRWRVRALDLAFGSAGRGLGLLAVAVLAPVITLPLAVGPFLLGPSLPVLCGLALFDRAAPPGAAAGRQHGGHADTQRLHGHHADIAPSASRS